MKKIIVLAALLISSRLYAYQVTDLQVIKYGARYLVTFDAFIDAPADNVTRVISDFENISQLSPAVKKTEVHRFDKDTARVAVVMRPCVYIFCKTLSKLSIVQMHEGEIIYNGVEDAGSFRTINETINYASIGAGTSLSYKGNVSPKFYVPSWLGVRFIRASMYKYLGEMLAKIETKANAGV